MAVFCAFCLCCVAVRLVDAAVRRAIFAVRRHCSDMIV